MQLTINIANEQLFEKIVWLLNSFKNDGLEIIYNSREKYHQSELSKDEVLKNLETSVSEMKMINEGKLKATSAREFLDEL